MKDKKSILLLIVSFLLLLVSCTLLWTWGYRVIRAGEGQPPAVNNNPVRHDTLAVNAASSQTDINAIQLHADSLKAQLDAKLAEFNLLREQINGMLSKAESGGDSSGANPKVNTLQLVVDNLRNRNRDVENENKRLRTVLEQLSSYVKNNPARRTAFESNNTESPADNTSPTGYAISDMKLAAIAANSEQEEETSEAMRTGKFVCTFTVRNSSSNTGSNEVVVVLVQPDGRVLQPSPWESGLFNTPQGRRIYSYKAMVDLTKGEARKLSFTLNALKYLKGNYSMQVYHNGTMIARLSKTLG